MSEDDKIKMASRRAELIAKLATQIAPTERVQVQGELSILNAKIKAANTIAAAQAKAAADRKKVAGLKEHATNTARALANIGLDHSYQDDVACPACGTDSNGGCLAGSEPSLNGQQRADDPGQSTAVDLWIVSVLRRGGVKVSRAKGGALNMFGVPQKWGRIIDALSAGIHAAARGEELPEITAEETNTKGKKR